MDISRSEIDAIINCEEQAYGTYREDSHGYAPSDPFGLVEATQGTALHHAGARIFTEGPESAWRDDISKALVSLPEPHRNIRTTLIQRAVLGWTLKRYPAIVSEWKPLGAEIPFKWELTPGYHQPLRLDDIMEHRSNGSLAIFDFKTAGAPDLNWIERKKNSKQTHLYVKALKDVTEPLGKHVAGMMYDCIEIGKWDNKKEIHKSVFTIGYKKSGKISPKYSYGAEIVSLLDYTEDQWLKWALATKALDGLYWTTGLFTPPVDTLIRTQESVAQKVKEWDLKLTQIRSSSNPRETANKLLVRNDHACLTFGWEKKCVFYDRCWKNLPLGKDFEPRKDHHKTDENV